MKDRWELSAKTAGGVLDGTLLVLWHGAGGDIGEASLVETASVFAGAGADVARARLGYRREGKKLPDRMPVCVTDARETIALLRAEIPGARRLLLGGRSMGGRVASMLVAEGFAVDGLIFLSYPLHPEGKPQQLRDAHLPQIPCPMLFLSGDRDALCELSLLRPVLQKIGPRATLEVFPDADHSFRRKGDIRAAAARALIWAQALR